jgi:hypothetical protein
VAIPDDAVQVHPGAGKAELHVANLPIEDYFNLPNALRDGPEVDATVSFDVVWSSPVTRRVSITNGTNGDQFVGNFAEDQATVTWSGSNALGFRFHSNPGDLSTSAPGRAFAELGHVRNGLFFGEGEGDDEGMDSSPARGSASNRSGRDQAFAAPGLPGENWALQPTSVAWAPGATDLALWDSWNDPQRGPGQVLLTSGSQNGLVNGFTRQTAPLGLSAEDGAFTRALDQSVTSLLTDVGLPGEVILFG